MNRIYQGRVTNVEIANPDKQTPPDHRWLPFDADPKQAKAKWQTALWQHHQLFQDAVNYYLFCLAAMASDGSTPMGKLRNQLGDVWEPFVRKSKRFKGLRAVIVPYVLPGKSQATIEDAFAATLDGNSSSKELLQLAVDALVEDLGGEAKIQQGGRTYWPMFCNPDSNPTFPRSNAKLERDAAREWLPGWLHDSKTSHDLTLAARRLKVGLFANVAAGEPDIAGDDAKKRLCEAIQFLAEANPSLKTNLGKLVPMVNKLPATTAFPRYVGSSVKGADKRRFNAFLIFKYVE